MSKMNVKKEMLEKKEAMREIKDNEVENVSGGVMNWITHGIKGDKLNNIAGIGIETYEIDNKADALKKEKDFKKKGYVVF